jgi:hypothetical protein
MSTGASILKDGPDFCHGFDCPKFTVTDKKEGYEVRKYEASKWVGVLVPSMNFSSAVDSAYTMLHDYISGKNSASTKIPMTTPVATKIEPGQGPACDSNFTTFFFVPYSLQSNTPTPTNQQLSLVNLPELTAYVGVFGGFEGDNDLITQATLLATALDKNKEEYVADYYFTAQYDPPTRTANRHNEIWFIAK